MPQKDLRRQFIRRILIMVFSLSVALCGLVTFVGGSGILISVRSDQKLQTLYHETFANTLSLHKVVVSLSDTSQCLEELSSKTPKQTQAYCLRLLTKSYNLVERQHSQNVGPNTPYADYYLAWYGQWNEFYKKQKVILEKPTASIQILSASQIKLLKLIEKIEPVNEFLLADANNLAHSSAKEVRKSKRTLMLIILLSVLVAAILSFFIVRNIKKVATDLHQFEKMVEEQREQLIASSKLSSLGEMAAGIAHEINNPLSVITGYSSQLTYMCKKGQVDIPLLQDMGDKIEKMAHRISSIVRGLKTYAREGTDDPFLPTSIKDLITESFELCSERLRKLGVKYNILNISDDLMVDCRSTQISQILINLVSNSIDAVEKLSDRWIRVEIKEIENKIQIHLTDSGTGIDPKIANKLFQPFFTTKAVGKGTGLGLSISKNILDAHGGKIYVDQSCPNTRFVIELPKTQSQTHQGSQALAA